MKEKWHALMCKLGLHKYRRAYNSWYPKLYCEHCGKMISDGKP